MQILYIPIGVPTFHLESARTAFENSKKLLKALSGDVVVPEDIILSIDGLKAYLAGKAPELAIVQNVTFANAAYMQQILMSLDCPVLLWTLREPVIDGGRLRLNSLTGAFSAGNMLKSFARPFEYVFGSPDEDEVKKCIAATIEAVKLKKKLASLRLLQVGHTPEGFGFGRAQDAELAAKFGITLISIEARELVDRAKQVSDEEATPYLEKAGRSIRGLDCIDRKNVLDFARLLKAYEDYVSQNGIGALSSRCWPDFFTAYGTPVCAVLALLNDMGVPSSCEADTYGAISMLMASELTGKASFFGDPVSLDEEENTITFWHCGTGACSLAREDTGAQAGVHCNRKIGPTLEFGCKPCDRATVLRLGKDASGKFRLFVATGEALDKPKQFFGTSIVVRTDADAKHIVTSAVKDGWEPHFAVAMGDIAAPLKAFADILGIEVVTYDACNK